MTNDTIVLDPFGAHAHGSSCWWDHTQARWVCPAPRPVTDDEETVDVRDMVVVHTAMLREFRLAPAAVLRVAPGDRAAARSVERHLALLCDLLHHHHAGEDELLWPLLRERLPRHQQPLLDVAEAQHAGLDRALERVRDHLDTWRDAPDEGHGRPLRDALTELHRQLADHLEAEERCLLPLAAAHLSSEEWQAIGAAGASGVPKRDLPLVLGMFSYEGDPEVLATMLASAPLLPRLVVPRVGPRVYARRASALYGTRTP